MSVIHDIVQLIANSQINITKAIVKTNKQLNNKE